MQIPDSSPNHRGGSLISRRSALQIGALHLGGMGLSGLMQLRAEGKNLAAPRGKSVIMIYLPGGASHIDMYDMKPDAPSEYRGDFRPIATNADGIQVCELMPQHAKIADKFSILRGLQTRGNHDPTELLTGVKAFASGQIGPSPRPAIGCVLSKLRGSAGPIPPYVSVSSHKLLGSYDDPENPAYLGPAHRPVSVAGEIMKDLTLRPDLGKLRLDERRSLLGALDREHQGGGDYTAVDGFQIRAMEMLASSEVRDALDLSREPESVRRAYGESTDPKKQGLDLLRARRLVEAGVPLVSIAARFPVSIGGGVNDPGGWDTHASNFKILQAKLPIYDQAVAALISDLHDRGMLETTAVVVWSEFGRKPKIGDVTPDGRGHWPKASCALIAGGGLKMGRAVGATDRLGEGPHSKGYTPQDVLATIYHVLGIDPLTTLLDHAGRPQFLLDHGRKIADLI